MSPRDWLEPRKTNWVATALRTAITKQRNKVRAVFTGSSRTRLARVFSNTDTPLYFMGTSIQDFPLLDKKLVEFVALKFQQATQSSLDVAQGWQELLAFKQQPEPFLAAVVAVLMDPSLTLERACELEKVEQNKAENHEGTWSALDAVQKQLVRLLAEDAKPFSKTVLARLRKSLGLPVFDTTSVQFALRKLSEKSIVSKSARGAYVFESDACERWVRTLGPDVNGG